MDTVLGVDACKTGWVGIAWSGTTVTPHYGQTIAALADAAGPVSVIAIDIPIEVHPEVSFTQLAGEPLPRKKTWAGAARRRELLEKEGIVLPGDLGPAGEAAVDDILDAAVAAWTARRVHAATAIPLPDPPEPLGGIEAAIWR